MNTESLHAVDFTVFDWMLVALLVYSTVRAALKGFILEVFSLVGLVAGILLASWNYGPVAEQVVSWVAPLTKITLTTAEIVAFLGIVIGVMMACGLAGKFLRTGASAIGLGLVDRALGAAFGFARGCLLGVSVMLALAAFDPMGGPGARLTARSQLLPYFLAGAHGVSFVVPEGLQRRVADGADEIKHKSDAWIKQSP